MKGKQLSLQEVLNLEDGTKVWVEPKNDTYGIKCYMGYLLRDFSKCRVCFSNNWEDYSYTEKYFSDFDAYEWIKDDTPLHKMSVEICNLRGLDLTDDNIRLTVEEFSK